MTPGTAADPKVSVPAECVIAPFELNVRPKVLAPPAKVPVAPVLSVTVPGVAATVETVPPFQVQLLVIIRLPGPVTVPFCVNRAKVTFVALLGPSVNVLPDCVNRPAP